MRPGHCHQHLADLANCGRNKLEIGGDAATRARMIYPPTLRTTRSALASSGIAALTARAASAVSFQPTITAPKKRVGGFSRSNQQGSATTEQQPLAQIGW